MGCEDERETLISEGILWEGDGRKSPLCQKLAPKRLFFNTPNMLSSRAERTFIHSSIHSLLFLLLPCPVQRRYEGRFE